MPDSTIINELKRALTVETESIAHLADSVDMASLEKTVRLLGDCGGRILLTGCGTSAMACRKISHSLCCIERPAGFLVPSDGVHGGLGLVQKNDVVIMVSKGGNTEELVRMIPACKEKGAALVGVTENADSIIAREADLPLLVKVAGEPCRFNMLATASTLAVIAVFDAVCIALMQYTNYTREKFAVIHPGGAVGERLLGRKAQLL